MKKLNWSVAFIQFTQSNRSTPFAWGSNDCVMFAADAVKLMTDVDPASASRGKYKTETGAKRHLASKYGDLYSAWDSQLVRHETIHFVQNGDVVLFDGALGLTSGIYWNGGVFAPTLEGVRFMDEMHNSLLAAWRV